MPVEDRPVHPRTVFSGRYGCHGRVDFAESYMAPGGYVPHRMSRECRYDQSHTDAACTGCPQAGKGIAYAEAVRERANVERNRPAAGLPDDGPVDGPVGPRE